MNSPNFSADAPEVSPTPSERVDTLLERLAARKDDWVRTPIERRIRLLDRCIACTQAVAKDWVRAACRAKGLDPNEPRAGEEWLSGPLTTTRNLRLLAEALAQGGRPQLSEMSQRRNGQWVARVFPTSRWDRLLFRGFYGEVWIAPDRAPTQGRSYRMKAADEFPTGHVALVLGAGNVSSIGPMDALYKLFVENKVVILKTSPVNAYLQPYWEASFRPLIDEGVFYVIRGGANVGRHLVQHEKVDTIHITGSNQTHDAILWGADPKEQARRKAAGEPLVDKPISSELGAVTPVLAVPGPWSDTDLAYQARHVAAMVANNASFNCNAAQVLAVAERWPQSEVFFKKVAQALAAIPPREAYYPGAQARYARFLEHYPQAVALDPRSSSATPWTLIPGVPAEPGEFALANEAFCGILAQTRLPASTPASFLEAMVEFANEACWGTLSCVILIHPKTQRAYAKKLDSAIERLRYGNIGINVWTGVSYGMTSPTWGAFPGHPLEDIRSGRGVVHNTFMFDHPERSVVYAPFRVRPTPAWFADHRTAHRLGEALTRFEAKPGLLRLSAVLSAALRG
ncbi:aldehyde dehydrogenase family protein [Nitrococcus mobilis]|nr:aldehyde dehydrogenase family protein [Nitrococcus mobilis]